MIQRIIQLARCVCIIEHHENRTNPRRSKENRDILLAVPRHDAYPVPLLDPHRQHAARNAIRFIVQICVCPSRAGPGKDKTLVVSILQALKGQELAESHVEQFRLGRPIDNGELLGLRGLQVRKRLLEAADGAGHGAVRGRRAGRKMDSERAGPGG